MALYRFVCTGCGKTKRKIIMGVNVALNFKCECGGELSRAPNPPSTMVTEKLDNGIMSRAVERPADAERLYAERARQTPEE